MVFSVVSGDSTRDMGTLKQTAQRGCGIFIPGDIQNPAGHSPGHQTPPDPVQSGELGLDNIYRDFFPFQQFCDCVGIPQWLRRRWDCFFLLCSMLIFINRMLLGFLLTICRGLEGCFSTQAHNLPFIVGTEVFLLFRSNGKSYSYTKNLCSCILL